VTLAEALQAARKRISIVQNGDSKYRVDHWSPQHDAVFRSALSYGYFDAQVLARAMKIAIALELLGMDPADADHEAERHKRGRFEEAVGRLWSKQRGGRPRVRDWTRARSDEAEERKLSKQAGGGRR
jgi:hypothetical protein